MAQRVDDVIHLCCKIADQPEFKKTWINIRKGMSITATGAGVGALLLGPPGFFFGGAVGGLIAWLVTSGQFKSLPQILMELPRAEKQNLYNDVVAVLDNPTWRDAAQLVAIVMNNPKFQQSVSDVLLKYMKQNL